MGALKADTRTNAYAIIGDHKSSLVCRADLKALALSLNEHPEFLSDRRSDDSAPAQPAVQSAAIVLQRPPPTVIAQFSQAPPPPPPTMRGRFLAPSVDQPPPVSPLAPTYPLDVTYSAKAVPEQFMRWAEEQRQAGVIITGGMAEDATRGPRTSMVTG